MCLASLAKERMSIATKAKNEGNFGFYNFSQYKMGLQKTVKMDRKCSLKQ